MVKDINNLNIVNKDRIIGQEQKIMCNEINIIHVKNTLDAPEDQENNTSVFESTNVLNATGINLIRKNQKFNVKENNSSKGDFANIQYRIKPGCESME